MQPIRHSLTSLALHLMAMPLTHATIASKRGFGFVGDSHISDNNLLLSQKSPLDWYYTWSLNEASSINSTLEFLPLITSTDDATNSQLGTILDGLPSSSTHLLTFNEPDGTTSSGGSSIEPSNAARIYLDNIAPLRNSTSRTWNISYPAVTGSDQGLTWLQSFNESCYDIDPAGCPMDFVALHWYGDFAGLESWLGQLYEFYNPDNSTDTGIKFWVTEMALPQGSEDDTVSMLNQSMAYLDGLDYVGGYAWYGAFREDEGSEGFTGSEVSLFDDDGGLTELGALYLGGSENGFTQGMKGEGAASTLSLSVWAAVSAGLAIAVAVL